MSLFLFYFLLNDFDSVFSSQIVHPSWRAFSTTNYNLYSCAFLAIYFLSEGKRGKSVYYKIKYINFLQYFYASIQTVLRFESERGAELYMIIGKTR